MYIVLCFSLDCVWTGVNESSSVMPRIFPPSHLSSHSWPQGGDHYLVSVSLSQKGRLELFNVFCWHRFMVQWWWFHKDVVTEVPLPFPPMAFLSQTLPLLLSQRHRCVRMMSVSVWNLGPANESRCAALVLPLSWLILLNTTLSCTCFTASDITSLSLMAK